MRDTMTTEDEERAEAEESDRLEIAYENMVAARAKVAKQLEEKYEAAMALVKEMAEISEASGIPFDFNGETYVPDSMLKFFPGVEDDIVCDLCDVTWIPRDCESGWHNSSTIC